MPVVASPPPPPESPVEVEASPFTFSLTQRFERHVRVPLQVPFG
jgi:hypothetical protein